VSREECRNLMSVDGESSPEASSSRSGAVNKWRAAVLSATFGSALVGATVYGIQGKPHLRAAESGLVTLDAANFGQCHTAVEGEPCYKDVRWAMTDGIINHPEWYSTSCSTLTPDASFEEFQVCVYRINQTKCALPCSRKKAVVEEPDVEEVPTTTTTTTTPVPKDICHIAKPGETCFQAVSGLMLAAKEHPDRLRRTANSTFEQIQKALHKASLDSKCPRPCDCHTVEEGERCYNHVLWAMREGVKARPLWYPGLTENSSFAEFQAHLHRESTGDCPVPCSGVTAETLENGAANTTQALLVLHPELDEDHCHTAMEGEKCYDNVVYAIQKGILDHPEWYQGLTAFSTFEEFQMSLHKTNPALGCGIPCSCETAKKGDKCYDNIHWVLSEGIPQHPDWYQGLTQHSRIEEVQQRLHEDTNTNCHKPCMPKMWGTPSLFCVAVFRSTGYELDLVRSQVAKGVGIFACDEFSMLSDAVLDVTDDLKTLLIPPCEKVGVSKDGTAANTLVFMQAWQVIKNEGRYKAHDWVIKADPDAVVIVPRLRKHLAEFTGKTTFIKNCMKYTGPGWPMMFGSLEAFSRQAIDLYYEGADRCKKELEWDVWGEDLFMGNCLKMLGADSDFDGGIIGDNVCKGADCKDGTTAVYHPFKDEESYFQCYNDALATEPTR